MGLQQLFIYFNQHYLDNFHTDNAALITGQSLVRSAKLT